MSPEKFDLDLPVYF